MQHTPSTGPRPTSREFARTSVVYENVLPITRQWRITTVCGRVLPPLTQTCNQPHVIPSSPLPASNDPASCWGFRSCFLLQLWLHQQLAGLVPQGCLVPLPLLLPYLLLPRLSSPLPHHSGYHTTALAPTTSAPATRAPTTSVPTAHTLTTPAPTAPASTTLFPAEARQRHYPNCTLSRNCLPQLPVRFPGSVCLPACLPAYCTCLFACLPIYLSVCLPLYLSTPLSVCPSVCLSVCLPLCLPACLPVCLPACLFVCLSVCLSTRLSVCLPEAHIHTEALISESLAARHPKADIKNDDRLWRQYSRNHIALELRCRGVLLCNNPSLLLQLLPLGTTDAQSPLSSPQHKVPFSLAPYTTLVDCVPIFRPCSWLLLGSGSSLEALAHRLFMTWLQATQDWGVLKAPFQVMPFDECKIDVLAKHPGQH